jgi:hypothetical protein
MFKTKLLTGILLVAAILFAQAGTVLAAPQAQDTTMITGTITNIVAETDEFGVTTVLVTIVDDMEVEQTVRLGVDTAVELGLVTLDPDTMEPIVDESQIGLLLLIDPTTVIPDEEPTEEPEESNHPISILLAAFFGEDASVIDGYHDNGYGFGVIAQSLWMSQNISGDSSLTQDILLAKQDKDFETFFEDHPEYTTEGEALPTNWGQFKKTISEKKNNLGSVISGHAENDSTEETITEQSMPGNSQNNGNNNNGKGNSNKDKDKSNNGKGNNK